MVASARTDLLGSGTLASVEDEAAGPQGGGVQSGSLRRPASDLDQHDLVGSALAGLAADTASADFGGNPQPVSHLVADDTLMVAEADTGPGDPIAGYPIAQDPRIAIMPQLEPMSYGLFGFPHSVTFSEHDVNLGPQLISPSVDFTFPGLFNSGRVDIGPVSYDPAHASFSIGIRNEGTGPGQISVGTGAPTTINYGGVLIGWLLPTAFGGATVSFSVAGATQVTSDMVNAVLRNLTFSSNEQAPDPSDPFHFTLSISNDGSQVVGSSTLDIALTPSNDAPFAFIAPGGPPAAIGDETLVNTATAANQSAARVAALTGGGYVVTWTDGSLGVGGATGDASGSAVKAQVFNADGSKLGGEILVNSATAGNQLGEQITRLSNGGFVITWIDSSLGVGGATGDASNTAVKAQIFGADGSRAGGEILVNSAVAGAQNAEQIIALSGGNFVVTWTDNSLGVGGAPGDTSGPAIKAQVFGADGSHIGGEILVNTATASNQVTEQITALANGGFVVTWADSSQGVGGAPGDTSAQAIKAQIFAADGSRTGGEVLLNQQTSGSQIGPQITALTNGGFAAAWTDLSGFFYPFTVVGIFDAAGQRIVNDTAAGGGSGLQIAGLSTGGFVVAWADALDDGSADPTVDNSGLAIKILVYDAAGYLVDDTTLVNTAINGDQVSPRIVTLPNGNFVITWTDFGNSAGGAQGDPVDSVKGQLFAYTGDKIGGEFLINTAVAGTQSSQQVTALANGDFVVVWADGSAGVGGAPGDSSGLAVKAQTYSIAYHAINDVPLDLKGHMGVTDPDAANGIVTVTLSATTGILNVTAGTSGAVVTDNGTGSVTITGTLAQVDNLLLSDPTSTVTFVASGAAPGTGATLTLTIDDNGNTGGGNLSASWTYGVVIDHNLAPSGSDRTVSLLEDHTYVLGLADFSFVDANLGALQAVRITTLPGAGTLWYDADGAGAGAAVAVTAGQSISAADISAGKLSFVPGANGNGVDYAHLGFQVQDDGGTAAGGVDLDPTPNILTFNVLDVYDPPARFPAVVHLSTIGADGFAIIGDAAGDFAGGAVSGVGDFNGDGFADYLVGASGNGATNNGAAYLIYGKASGFGTLDLTTISSTDGFAIFGGASSDNAGVSVAGAGDVNGDGYDDLLIGAPLNAASGPSSPSAPGAAYVLFGTAAGYGGLTLASLTPPFISTQGFKIQGAAGGDSAGFAVAAAGDVNGDGYADILVGANHNDSGGADAGAAYLIYGKASGFGLVDLATLSAADGVKFQGAAAGDLAGRVSSAGDINHDGYADILIGATRNDSAGSDAGAAYLIYGKAAGFGALVDLAGLSAADGFKIQGAPWVNGATGAGVSSAGDVNGDGYDDIVIGAPGNGDAGTVAGAAYVIFGKAGGFGTVLDLSTLTATQGFEIIGDLASDRAGLSVSAAGDVNGDGYADILIGANGHGTGVDAGAAYVIFGKADGFGTIDLSSLSPRDGFIIQGDTAGDLTGTVSAAGDINNDGYDDILVGAPRNDVGGTDAGAAYVIFGRPNPGLATADSFAVNENAAGSFDVTANDGSGTVSAVNGTTLIAGQSVTLASGAIVTLNANGTLSYDPHGAFNYLVSAATAAATGAVDASATDSFSYTLNGTTATVTMTVNGVDGAGDQLRGDAGNNVMTGSGGADLFLLQQGGTDSASGGGGNDGFYFGAALDATDSVDGGVGGDDQVGLQGDYTGANALTFGANNLSGIETLVILSGATTTFGDTAGNLYGYDLTTIDANVDAGKTLTVNANLLHAGENLTFNGAAETDGSFLVYGGLGNDSLTGGQGSDAFFFGDGGRFTAADHVDGQGGADDQLGLRGDYSGGLVFGAGTMTNIETLVLLSASDVRFAPAGTAFDYNITLDDANVGAGKMLTVNANALHAGEDVTFNGSAETDGSFRFLMGAGNDALTGGANDDQFYGRLGQDVMTGGGGNDIFYFRAMGESTAGAMDHIMDFNSGDHIDLSAIDASTTHTGNDAFAFIGEAAFSNVAGELRVVGAGSDWTIQGDLDGDGIADISIAVTTIGGHFFGSGDFVL